MAIISLLTDFGLKDNFAGVVKAVILKINPQIQIVDICHWVSPHDVREAAFLLRSSYRFFPVGTIHLVIVDPGVGSHRQAIAAETEDYLFVGPDNGVLALALKEQGLKSIVQITNEEFFLKPVSDTFHGRDVFAPVAAHLSLGIKISRLGPLQKDVQPCRLPDPVACTHFLEAEVLYVDRFGNLVTNLTQKNLGEYVKGEKVCISIGGKSIKKISHSYSEVRPKNLLCIFDSFGYLEISLNQGNASDYLGLGAGAKFRVEIPSA